MLTRFSFRLMSLAAVAVLVLTVSLPAPIASAGDYELPFETYFVQEVDKTRFSNDWGDSRSGGRRHKGTDLLATEKMVEVYAFADGVISTIKERSRPGRYVYIDHGQGWTSIYIHLNDDNIGTDDGKAPWYLTLAPGVEEGAEVKVGQLIGWVGDSGNAEGASPHTHFELLHNGRNVNPYPYLADAAERAEADMIRREQMLNDQIAGLVLIV